jgi:hypothetical protein
MSLNRFNYCPRCGISIIFEHRGQSVKDGAQHFDIRCAAGHFAQLHYLVGPPVLVASVPAIDPTACPKDCEFEVIA